MKPNHSVQSITAGLAFAAAVAFVSTAAYGKETKITFESLPAPVHAAATAAAGKGKIESVTSDMEDKVMTYEVAVSEGSHKYEHKFAADGKLLESEEAVAIADLPAAVRTAFEKAAGSDKILEIVRVTAGEKKFYEADISEKDGVREVKVSAEGAVLASKHEKSSENEAADADEDSDKEGAEGPEKEEAEGPEKKD